MRLAMSPPMPLSYTAGDAASGSTTDPRGVRSVAGPCPARELPHLHSGSRCEVRGCLTSQNLEAHEEQGLARPHMYEAIAYLVPLGLLSRTSSRRFSSLYLVLIQTAVVRRFWGRSFSLHSPRSMLTLPARVGLIPDMWVHSNRRAHPDGGTRQGVHRGESSGLNQMILVP